MDRLEPTSDPKHPFRSGPYVFRSAEQAHHVVTHNGLIKSPGWMIDPRSWRTQLRSLIAGDPQRTVGLKCPIREERHGANGFSLDGPDELTDVTPNAADSKAAVAAFEMLLLYPVLLPLTHIGYMGTLRELRETGEDVSRAEQRGEELRRATLEVLAREIVATEGISAMLKRGALSPRRVQRFAESVERILEEHEAEKRRAETGGQRPKGLVRRLCERLHLDQVLELLDRKDLAFFRKALDALAALEAAGGDRVVIEQCVETLAAYKRNLDERLVGIFRRMFENGPAMLSSSMSWWGLGVLEAEAIARFAGAVPASATIMQVSNAIQMGGQVAMMVYGLATCGDGVWRERSLKNQRNLVADSRLLVAHPALRASIVAQIDEMRRWNAAGKIAGGSLMFGGQALLLASSLSGLGWPLQVPGVVMTCAAIALRTAADIIATKRFGFDPGKLDLEPLKRVVASTTDADRYQLTVDILAQMRAQPRRELAWIKVFRAMRAVVKAHPGAPVETQLHRIEKRLGAAYRRGYQAELREELDRLLADPENRCFIREGLEGAGRPGQLLFTMAAKLEELRAQNALAGPPREAPCREIATRIAGLAGLAPRPRLEALIAILRDADIYDDTVRRTLKEMVVAEQSRGNRRGARYAEFIERDSILKERSLRIPLLPKIPIRKKTKAVYYLNMDKVLAAMTRRPGDPLVQHVADLFHAAAEKAFLEEYKFGVRSQLLGADVAIMSCIDQDTVRQRITPVAEMITKVMGQKGCYGYACPAPAPDRESPGPQTRPENSAEPEPILALGR